MGKLKTPAPCQTKHELKHGLFDLNDLPFAAYADAGWTQLQAITRPRIDRYEQHTPLSLANGFAQFRTVTNRFRWGQSRVFSGGATWTTTTEKGACRGRGGSSFPGRSLTERDILRALTRDDVYAVARCDAEVDTGSLPYARYSPYTWPEEVSCLIFDVDMDMAWAKNDVSAVRREVWLESEVLRLLQLRGNWLKTGGRGHQVVVPLPCCIPRSAASLIVRATAALLSQLQEPGQAICDTTNVDGIVRLAGGRHAKTNDLSLFFDPEALTIYSIDAQLKLLSTAYCSSDYSEEEKQTFRESTAEIADYLNLEHGINRGEIIDRSPSGDKIACGVVQVLRDNWFAGNARDACERLLGTSLEVSSAKVIIPVADKGQMSCVSRAMEIWSAGYAPGGSWHWLVKGDGQGTGNGVWAAFALFTGEGAERELLLQSEKIGATTQTAMNERNRTIRLLCRSHQSVSTIYGETSSTHNYQNAANVISGTLTSDMLRHVDEIMAQLIKTRRNRETGRKSRFQDRQLRLLRQIIAVFVMGFSCRSLLTISRRTLAASIVGLWPDTGKINHNTLQNNLLLLTEGKVECLLPLLRPTQVEIRSWNLLGKRNFFPDVANEVTHYVPGIGMDSILDAWAA